MTKSKSTKRSLLVSGLVLIMCVTMLIGSTFAWFTDSVTSANNKIKAGTLDVQLLMDADVDGNYDDISNNTAPIFGAGSIAQNNNAETLWEPGKTQVAYLAIKNNGNLALKYKVALDVKNVSKDLYKAMEYAIVPDADVNNKVTAWTTGNDVVVGKQDVSDEVSLGVGATHYFALAIHMKETAGNEYQDGEVDFDLTVLATQDTVEADSFGTDYDALAAFPYEANGVLTDGQSAVELTIKDTNGYNIGSAVIPADAVVAGNEININIDDSAYEANITVATGMETKAFDVTVTGLKDGNTTPIKVSLRILPGLDPATVKLYHYDTEIPCTYNPTTGYVTFESATFSPFTIVYDAESEYVAPAVPDGEHPTANVTNMTVAEAEAEVGAVVWGSYGEWSPNPNLEAELDSVYKFECTETAQEAAAGPYANWACDFYLKLDRDLGENQIFLGGNYGDFGWVGFHNGDVTLAANEEIPLLGSVVVNDWTYAQVAEYVGSFYCGAGDVDDALSGATLTVTLRVTDPEGNTYDAAVVNHTF